MPSATTFEADVCKQRFVLQDVSICTRFAHFCTAPNSIFKCQNSAKLSAIFVTFQQSLPQVFKILPMLAKRRGRRTSLPASNRCAIAVLSRSASTGLLPRTNLRRSSSDSLPQWPGPALGGERNCRTAAAGRVPSCLGLPGAKTQTNSDGLWLCSSPLHRGFTSHSAPRSGRRGISLAPPTCPNHVE